MLLLRGKQQITGCNNQFHPVMRAVEATALLMRSSLSLMGGGFDAP
jgi:hypothetical protein